MNKSYHYYRNTGLYVLRSWKDERLLRFRLGKNPRFELEKD